MHWTSHLELHSLLERKASLTVLLTPAACLVRVADHCILISMGVKTRVDMQCNVLLIWADIHTKAAKKKGMCKVCELLRHPHLLHGWSFSSVCLSSSPYSWGQVITESKCPLCWVQGLHKKNEISTEEEKGTSKYHDGVLHLHLLCSIRLRDSNNGHSLPDLEGHVLYNHSLCRKKGRKGCVGGEGTVHYCVVKLLDFTRSNYYCSFRQEKKLY